MSGPLVSDRALASIRTTLERGLVDSCVVSRITGRAKSALGHSVTRTNQAPQPCKYGPPGRLTQSGAERIVIGGQEVVVQAMVKMRANADVEQEDRLTVTIQETGEVIKLEVTYVRKKTREFSRSVLCKFIEPDNDTE